MLYQLSINSLLKFNQYIIFNLLNMHRINPYEQQIIPQIYIALNVIFYHTEYYNYYSTLYCNILTQTCKLVPHISINIYLFILSSIVKNHCYLIQNITFARITKYQQFYQNSSKKKPSLPICTVYLPHRLICHKSLS